MDEPPFLIDGARVLAYAALGEGRVHTAVAEGVALDQARAAAVIEALGDGAVYLLHCNERWETLAAEPHAGLEAAQDAARAQYPGIEWRPYRALSEEERAEIESTRAFLKDLTRDFPGGGADLA